MSEIETNNGTDEATDTRKQRTIRSFVRREGRITQAQRRALDELLPALDVDNNADGHAIRACFAQPQLPLCIEIGFGNGDSLLAMAESRPDWNFIGAEVYRPGVGKFLLGVERLALTNVCVTTRDAIAFINERVTANSLDAIYVFFPDPWPKKKHLKRRLINQSFVELACDRLKAGGTLHIATDIDSYAEQINELLEQQPQLVRTEPSELRPENAADEVPARPPTKYENRGRRLGHSIHDIVCRRQ